MGSIGGTNAWVGVKGAGSLDLRSENHWLDFLHDGILRGKKRKDEKKNGVC